MTTAKDVLAALELRHAKDVFIPECNLGSANAGCRRIDAWAMRRSWSPFRTIGYEIKVSRSDFLDDDKYLEYGGFCHELWLACPWGLIAPEETPPTIGLLWMNKGGRLVRKRKAVSYIEGNAEDIMRAMAYILMNRCTIGRPESEGERTITRGEWKEWLDTKQENYRIGGRVRDAIRKQVGELEGNNLTLESENKRWQALADGLREYGLDPDHLSSWNVKSQIDELRGIVDRRTILDVERASKQLAALAESLTALRKEDGQTS